VLLWKENMEQECIYYLIISPTIIGVVLTWIAHLVLLNYTKLWIVFIGMATFGIGIGFCYLAILRNTWKYFPDKKGFLSGFLLTWYGLSALIFTSIADYVINKDKIDHNSDGFYPEEVAQNLYYFIRFECIIFGVAGVFGILLTFPYKESIEVESKDNLNQFFANYQTTDVSESDNFERIKQGAFSKQNTLILIMLFSTQCIFISIIYNY
jgi:MFS family permease